VGLLIVILVKPSYSKKSDQYLQHCYKENGNVNVNICDLIFECQKLNVVLTLLVTFSYLQKIMYLLIMSRTSWTGRYHKCLSV